MVFRRQYGFTLMELMLVIGILTTIAIIETQNKILESEQQGARTLGMELYQYNVAVQKYLAHQSGVENPASLVGTKTGISWLKDASCGGSASSSYLSCNFLSTNNGKTSFGHLDFSTTISHDSDNGLAARTKMSKLILGEGERGDLSGLAALVASGAYAMSDSPAVISQDGKAFYCPDLDSYSASMTQICGSDKGHLLMFARNHAPQDKWLRTDHGNVMQNAIEFRSGDITPATDTEISSIDSIKRQIRNVARIYNLGDGNSNSESDNLYLGKMHGDTAKGRGTFASNAVVIDANQEVLGDLRAQRSLRVQNEIMLADGNLYIKDGPGGNGSGLAGNVIADRNITAGQNLVAGVNVIAQQDVIARRNLIAEQDAIAERSMIAMQDVEAKRDIKAQRNLDVGNNARVGQDLGVGRHMIAQGTVVGKHLHIKEDAVIDDDMMARGWISAGETVQAGTGMSSGGWVYAKGRLATEEYVQIGGIASEGGGCRPNGLIARKSSGDLLSCVSGHWKAASPPPPSGPQLYQCPPGGQECLSKVSTENRCLYNTTYAGNNDQHERKTYKTCTPL